MCIFIIALSMSSCATVFTGSKTDHQRTKPECGEPRRQIRPGALIFDLLLFPPGVAIDFATKKIYKSNPNHKRLKKCKIERE